MSRHTVVVRDGKAPPRKPVEFPCPDCKLNCQLSEHQRAIRHQLPVCKTWRAHLGKEQEFLRLALMAKGAAAVHLGDVDVHYSPEERKKLVDDIVEQVHAGLKEVSK